MLSSYADLAGIDLDAPPPSRPIDEGDVVCGAANTTPVFEVVARRGETLWVRRQDARQLEYLAPVSRFRLLSDVAGFEPLKAAA